MFLERRRERSTSNTKHNSTKLKFKVRKGNENMMSASASLGSRLFLLFLPCVLMLVFTSCGKRSSPKFTQYYVRGEKLYATHCSNCHQMNGRGLARLYPSLDTSDYMEKNFDQVICLMRTGIGGEIVVNGKEFNQPMPGNPSLSDLEIAEIATYIYNSWTHERGIVEVRDVSKILARCDAQN